MIVQLFTISLLILQLASALDVEKLIECSHSSNVGINLEFSTVCNEIKREINELDLNKCDIFAQPNGVIDIKLDGEKRVGFLSVGAEGEARVQVYVKDNRLFISNHYVRVKASNGIIDALVSGLKRKAEQTISSAIAKYNNYHLSALTPEVIRVCGFSSCDGSWKLTLNSHQARATISECRSELLDALDGKQIALKTHKRRYWTAQKSGDRVDTTTAEVHGWELFRVHRNGHRIGLQTHHGTFVTAYPEHHEFAVKNNVAHLLDWELFYVHLVNLNERRVCLRSAHGRYLSDDHDRVIANRDRCLGWEEFVLVE